MNSVTFHIELAWWFGFYSKALLLACRVMQREPDWDKVGRVIERAIRLKVVAA